MNPNKHILFGVAVAGVLLLTAGGLGYLILEERQAAEEKKNNVAALVQQYKKTQDQDSVAGGTSTTTVSIYSVPSGARVAVDGDSIGTTPLVGVSVPSNPVVLSLDRPRYLPIDTLVVPGSSSDGSYTFALRSAALARADGPVSPDASEAPGDAPETLSDDRTSPDSPADAGRSSEANETARTPPSSEVAGSEDAPDPPPTQPPSSSPSPERTVSDAQTTAPAGETTSPEPEPSSVKLSVLVLPWGSIHLDGRLAAMDTDVTYVTEVSPGRHELKVSHPALGTMQRMIDVSGDSTHVVADFDRAAKLAVTSTPPGAAIDVDGRSTGFRTPARLMLAPGSHEITVHAPGDDPASSTRVINLGRAADESVSFALGRPQAAQDDPQQ